MVTLYKDNLAEEQLVKLGLNTRQEKAVQYVKERGKITNKEYQEINNTSERTASRDLEELFQKSVFERIGEGKSTHYILIVGGNGG